MATCGALALSPAVAQAASTTWSGHGPGGGSWQQAANWNGGVTPADGDALTFPALAGCNPFLTACYASTATGGPLNASSLSIADDVPYNVVASGGISLTLSAGAGPTTLRAWPSGAGNSAAKFWVPIDLNGAQQWSITGNGLGTGALSLGFVSTTPGTDSPLTVTLQNQGRLYFDNEVDASAVSLHGSGEVNLQSDVANAAGDGPGVVNADGPSVVIGSIPGSPIDIGRLSLNGSALRIGSSASVGPGVTTEEGGLDLSATPTTTVALQGMASVAGRDYGQLTVNGDVTLGGQLSLLDVSPASATCPSFAPGTVDTFIRASGGTISGQFADLPNDSVVPLVVHCAGSTRSYAVQIGYSPTAITGTFVGAPSGTPGSGSGSARGGGSTSGGSSTPGRGSLPAAAQACLSTITHTTGGDRRVRATVTRGAGTARCTLTLRLRATQGTGSHRHTLWLGRTRATVTPHSRRVWAVALNARGRRLLTQRRALHAQVVLQWSSRDRTVTLAARGVMLRAALTRTRGAGWKFPRRARVDRLCGTDSDPSRRGRRRSSPARGCSRRLRRRGRRRRTPGPGVGRSPRRTRRSATGRTGATGAVSRRSPTATPGAISSCAGPVRVTTGRPGGTLRRVAPASTGSLGRGARARILAAARQLFADPGINATGIAELVARSRVSRRTLYQQFGSKDELIVAYLRDLAADTATGPAGVLERNDLTPRARLLELFAALGAGPGPLRGDPFLAAAVEIADPRHPARRVIAERGAALARQLAEIAREAGARDSERLGERLLLLYAGASARVVADDDAAPAAEAMALAGALLADATD